MPHALIRLALVTAALVLAAPANPPQSVPLHAPVRVCAGGDVTLGTNLDPSWARRAADSLRTTWGLSSEPDSLVAALRPLFADADIGLVNVEGAIGSGPAPQKCRRTSSTCYAFRMPPAAAGAIRRIVGASAAMVGNTANNHSHDAGDAGRAATIAALTRAGVAVTGADTLATIVVTAAGDTIAVLGFHTDKITPDARDLVALRRHVSRAVSEYRTVIVTMHLGAEGATAQRTRNRTEMFLGENRGNPVAFANAALAAGATLVIGHGPHVLRAAEWRGGQMVFYSLGNLVTYGPFNVREPMNRGVVACAVIEAPGRVVSAELRPTMQLAAGRVLPDSDKRAIALIDSLSALDFPKTGVRVGADGAVTRRQ